MLSRVRRRARGAINLARERFTSSAVVLMYHRIGEAEVDPWGISVSPRDFREQMEVLRSRGVAVSLPSLARNLAAGRIADRSVAVTFDDGYLDNLTTARPILEDLGIPATIFFTTRQFEREGRFWWDDLERAMLLTPELPGTLELRMRGEAVKWPLGPARRYSAEDRVRDRGIPPWEAAHGTRLGLYYELYERLRILPDREREEALAELIEWAGVGTIGVEIYDLISEDELLEIASSPLIDIGAHTINHPFLSSRSPEEQAREMVDGRARLEELTGRPVTAFAYPHGDVTPDALETARVHFDCACGIEPRRVTRWSDPFRLPRFQAPDCDGDRFASLFLGG